MVKVLMWGLMASQRRCDCHQALSPKNVCLTWAESLLRWPQPSFQAPLQPPHFYGHLGKGLESTAARRLLRIPTLPLHHPRLNLYATMVPAQIMHGAQRLRLHVYPHFHPHLPPHPPPTQAPVSFRGSRANCRLAWTPTAGDQIEAPTSIVAQTRCHSPRSLFLGRPAPRSGGHWQAIQAHIPVSATRRVPRYRPDPQTLQIAACERARSTQPASVLLRNRGFVRNSGRWWICAGYQEKSLHVRGFQTHSVEAPLPFSGASPSRQGL